MRTSRPHLKFLPLAAAALAAVAALTIAAAPSALADGMVDMPGMSAEEHGAEEHDAMPGMDMSGRDEPATDTKRPVALVLLAFGLINGLAMGYAAVIRRRPDALKRRQTLARVRGTPPEQTVFPSSSTPSSQS